MKCETCLHNEICRFNSIPTFGMDNVACQYEAHELVGEWIIRGDNTFITCSTCGYMKGMANPYFRTHFEQFPNFCEMCGADMREGDEKC